LPQDNANESTIADEIPFPEPAWLKEQAIEPLPAYALQEAGRAREDTGQNLEAPSNPDQYPGT
jgi:hypothetical protein